MTKVGRPPPAVEPTHSGSHSQSARDESPLALGATDTVERSRSKDPHEGNPAGLSRGLTEPGRERPLDHAIVQKAFAVLETLFADPTFLATLTSLAVVPRLGQIAASVAAATALLTFLG